MEFNFEDIKCWKDLNSFSNEELIDLMAIVFFDICQFGDRCRLKGDLEDESFRSVRDSLRRLSLYDTEFRPRVNMQLGYCYKPETYLCGGTKDT